MLSLSYDSRQSSFFNSCSQKFKGYRGCLPPSEMLSTLRGCSGSSCLRKQVDLGQREVGDAATPSSERTAGKGLSDPLSIILHSSHNWISPAQLLVLLQPREAPTGLQDAALQRPGTDSAQLQVCRPRLLHLVFRSPLSCMWMSLRILFNVVHVFWPAVTSKA